MMCVIDMSFANGQVPIEEVVESTEWAGVSRWVVRLTPIGNVKGWR